MRIPREEESGGTIINISSLLDVMFILIIFFMATTTFKEEERDRKINLPETGPPHSLSAAVKMVIINVRSAQGRKEGDPIYLVSNQPRTLEGLRDVVGAALKADPDLKVYVRGDRYAFHGEVAAAVSVCHRLGMRELNVLYDPTPIK